jgi:hypothetical protein
VKDFLKQKVAQNVANSLSYFIFIEGSKKSPISEKAYLSLFNVPMHLQSGQDSCQILSPVASEGPGYVVQL